ncbi:MAG: hypothetical protein D8M57_14995 [Candidatus Scalindua sp. AMX11]|nr:MAG: hypothetical protein DWQ00_04755 [Candidatus Scalindua sp.]NOG83630.1 multicopper oxidase domain-containing protein [Planctomycetota bacterium]RZV69619.1 MAG: hypothetical protein EX341_15800 [Candidatus Scalindua sp. SCAELEC01]TDE64118.1 MAG: hypothetical protein D8M57_14995 [Candidatus Scalindua sp. AMX11]GJQ60136.1 MAG: hypothetical protein SCALA701_29370 [Candidatus Scalindua sp.]
MVFSEKYTKYVSTFFKRQTITLCYLFAVILSLSVMAHATEKEIIGGQEIKESFEALSEKGEIEREFHIYITDGYQEMADGEFIYFWGYTHAKDWADVGKIDTIEERDEKLLPVRFPGDEMRFKSGKNYIVVLHNAGWYETEEHSGINHVAHTIHWHGFDLIPAVDGIPNIPYPAVFPHETFRYYLSIPEHIEGSYMGHCHVDSTNHIMAGLYFPVVIQKEEKEIYGYKYDREYTLFFSEIDSEYMEMLRDKGDIKRGLDWKSNYFMLNGRIFMDKLDNPLSTINDPKTRLVAYDGETVLVRLMAITYDHTFMWHPHGYHGLIVGMDGRKLPAPYEKDSIRIGSGERIDILYNIPDFSSQQLCLSCNRGAGITIAHDHNLMGMVSNGIYPHGGLTIFDVRPKSEKPKEDEWYIK